jgi:hypothetical protein
LSDDLSIKTIADFGAGSSACQAGATRYFLVREKFRDCKKWAFFSFPTREVIAEIIVIQSAHFCKNKIVRRFGNLLASAEAGN